MTYLNRLVKILRLGQGAPDTGKGRWEQLNRLDPRALLPEGTPRRGGRGELPSPCRRTAGRAANP